MFRTGAANKLAAVSAVVPPREDIKLNITKSATIGARIRFPFVSIFFLMTQRAAESTIVCHLWCL
jgi:hypothetical protein